MVKQFIGYGVCIEDSLDRTRNKEIDAIDVILCSYCNYLHSIFDKNVYQRCSNKTWFISAEADITLVEWLQNHCPRVYFRIPDIKCYQVLLKLLQEKGFLVGKDCFTSVKTFSNKQETIRTIVIKPMEEEIMVSILTKANIKPNISK